MFEQNIRVVQDIGGVCGMCDAEIPMVGPAIEVVFNVRILGFSNSHTEYMHVDCARGLQECLARRVAEAEGPQMRHRR